jgi:hypothetical protein
MGGAETAQVVSTHLSLDGKADWHPLSTESQPGKDICEVSPAQATCFPHPEPAPRSTVVPSSPRHRIFDVRAFFFAKMTMPSAGSRPSPEIIRPPDVRTFPQVPVFHSGPGGHDRRRGTAAYPKWSRQEVDLRSDFPSSPGSQKIAYADPKIRLVLLCRALHSKLNLLKPRASGTRAAH